MMILIDRYTYPDANSQTLIVLSLEAETILSPEGRKVTEETL